MKGLKRYLAVIVAVAMIVTAMVPAFAAETAAPTASQICVDLGMIVGDGGGVTPDYLATTPSRIQGAVMFLRLKGLEETAKAYTGTNNFADADQADWAKPIMAYLKDNPALGWIGVGNNTFDPNAKLTAQGYYKIMLEALGYKQGVEFEWDDVIGFAKALGMAKASSSLAFSVNDLAAATVEALKTPVKGDTKTLVATLVEAGKITADKAYAAALMVKPTITAITNPADITANVGDTVTLPETVKATFSDGSVKDVKVTWGTVDTSTVGTKVVEGTIADTDKKATVNVVVSELALTVDSVTASNLKEINVKFNKAVDKTTAETASNYVFTTTGSAAMGTAAVQADGMTVKLTLATAASQQENIDIKVQNVKDTAGTAMTAVTKNIVMLDVSIPEALSYAFTGPQTIEVTYSEPIDPANVGTALVDNGIYGTAVAIHNSKNNVLSVTLGTVLPEGAHTLKMSGAKDYVPYTALDKVFDITYTKDTSVPTVSIGSATQKKVVLNFSKAVKGDALTTTRFYQTYSAYQPSAVTDSAGAAIVASNYYDTVVLDFTACPLPAGTTNVVVLKTVGGITVTDRYGITLAADAVLPAIITADTTAPTITKVEATNESTVVITYSEDVTGADVKANFVFKKSDGTVIDPVNYSTPVYVGGTTLTSTITFTSPLAGGAYSVEVSNIKDSSVNTNPMVMVPQPFTVTDKTAITSASSIAVENAGTTPDVIYITYPEAMATSGPNSVLDLSNYKIGLATDPTSAVALSSSATITLFGGSDKVKVTLPGTSGSDLSGKSLYVRNVADAAGNVTSKLYIEITLGPDNPPVITAVKSTALNTFVMTVDKQLSAINADDILRNGVPAAQATYVNNSNGTATITVIVPAAQALATPGDLPSGFTIGANGHIKSLTGKPMASGAIAATLTDGVAPTVSTVVYVNPTTIDITFAEPLDTNSVAAAGKNGFSVSGGTLTSALSTSTTVIRLTGTGFTPDTDVIYTPGNITDANGNALAAISRTSVLSVATLTGHQAATPDNTFTVTATNFSYAYTLATGDVDMDPATAGVQPSVTINGLTYTVSVDGSGLATITVTGTATAAAAATTSVISITANGITETMTLNIPAVAASDPASGVVVTVTE